MFPLSKPKAVPTFAVCVNVWPDVPGRERALVRWREVGLCPGEPELRGPRLRLGPQPCPQHRNPPGRHFRVQKVCCKLESCVASSLDEIISYKYCYTSALNVLWAYFVDQNFQRSCLVVIFVIEHQFHFSMRTLKNKVFCCENLTTNIEQSKWFAGLRKSFLFSF